MCQPKIEFPKLFICNFQFKIFLFQLDTALKRMYNYLQRFAVGLEVMVEDQAMYDGDFIMEFNEAEYKLKAVSKNMHLQK